MINVLKINFNLGRGLIKEESPAHKLEHKAHQISPIAEGVQLTFGKSTKGSTRDSSRKHTHYRSSTI